MATAFITRADCLTHETPPGHPEQIARLVHVLHAIEGLNLKRVSAPMAAEDDVLRIHPASYLADLRRTLPGEGRKELGGHMDVARVTGCGLSRRRRGSPCGRSGFIRRGP